MLSVKHSQKENFSSPNIRPDRNVGASEPWPKRPHNQSRDQVDHGASDYSNGSTAPTNAIPLADLDLSRESERIKTFAKWPVSFMNRSQMAATGFYYYGDGDKVRCFFCNLEIGNWEEGDNPAVDHERWNSNCVFLRGLSLNIPLTSNGSSPPPNGGGGRDVCGSLDDNPNGGPCKPAYALESTRLSSFKDWPCRMKQTPAAMADAGFFYTGSGDKTACYYCGGGLKDWEDDDEPWVQHAQWFPNCYYIKTVKGADYIKEIRSRTTNRDFDSSSVKPPTPPPTTSKPESPAADDEASGKGEPNLCKLCFAEERNICFVPCGHVVACPKCALSVTTCPVCRQHFTSTMRLYYS